ncbi:hypothetical protein IHV84_04315 [Acidovorax sp. IB03]|jgi:hypothetical protein|uniref:hypothetical protein n=1 Tax=Acidovorax sp. IB03 TaxID=2779366 RepID=UPI0000DCCDAD|nr:hypothetical protein [Acidovorax sp. IB03]ABM43155.1 conserved hypothetical protein [Acidovorax sp. JS42]MBJ2163198.1 hypothetical protein [Acidovorax sp. IB03]
MRTEAEIRTTGMQALIAALGLVEAERFIAALSRDKFDYTQWRRTGLPDTDIETLAEQANQAMRQAQQKAS